MQKNYYCLWYSNSGVIEIFCLTKLNTNKSERSDIVRSIWCTVLTVADETIFV